MIGDAAGQGLRGLAQQIGRSAPQHQESPARARLVHQHSKHGEQLGPSLDLVDDDEAPERPESEEGIGQPREVFGILEIEEGHGPGTPGHELPCERRLAHLARAQEGDDGELAEQRSQTTVVGDSVDRDRLS